MSNVLRGVRRRRWGGACVVGALLAFSLCQVVAFHSGIADNILWVPSTPLRAAALAITFAPLVALATFFVIHRPAKADHRRVQSEGA